MRNLAPKPWKLELMPGGFKISSKKTGELVVELPFNDISVGQRDVNRVYANAKVISAAPEMLVLLIDFADYLEELHIYPEYRLLENFRVAIEKVVSKATGEA